MIADWTAWQPLHKEVRLFYGREAWQQLTSQENTTPTLLLRGANDVKDKNSKPPAAAFQESDRPSFHTPPWDVARRAAESRQRPAVGAGLREDGRTQAGADSPLGNLQLNRIMPKRHDNTIL
jgi:hypothetical protein